MNSILQVISYSEQTKKEYLVGDKVSDFETCDSDPSCSVYGRIKNSKLTFTLPGHIDSAIYIVIHRLSRFLGLSWLLITPLVGGTLLFFPVLGLTPPTSARAFWVALALNLYWLYFFLKKSRPSKLVSFDLNKNTNIADSFDAQSLVVIHQMKLKTQPYTPTHQDLFVTLLDHPRVRYVLRRAGTSSGALKQELGNFKKPSKGTDKEFSSSFLAAVFNAYLTAQSLGQKHVYPEDLFVATLKIAGKPRELVEKLGLNVDQIQRATRWAVESFDNLSFANFFSIFTTPAGGLNRDWTGTLTPELDRSGVDFTRLAMKGLLPGIVGRTKERAKVVEILSSSTKKNALLIGPAGAGKTSIVQAIASDIAYGRIGGDLKYKRLVSLNPGTFLSGTHTSGEIHERLERIVKDLQFGNVILFLDDIEVLSSTKLGEGEASILTLLEKSLSGGKLQVIAATTPEGYNTGVESEPIIARLFQQVQIPEPNLEETIQILLSYVPLLERKYKVFVTYPSVEECILLTNRYVHHKVLPDKAIEALESSVNIASKTEDRIVTKEVIEQAVSGLAKIPVISDTKKSKELLLHLETDLHKRVVGQEEAISAVSNAMRRLGSGLKDPNRPIASFLFLGPTGVGKTELAKTLCREYFGSESNMIRLDMGEFEDEHSINTLIGAPIGSKGYESGGVLTEAVKNQPFSLILLDEVEKAHPSVMNAFLSLLDEGKLSDSSGKSIDFTNTIIIATSNAGSEFIKTKVEQKISLESIREDLIKEIASSFRPEFLNRFDGIIIYKPLSRDEIKQITKILLGEVAEHLKEKGIEISFGEKLVEQVSELGFDPKFGARPLRRVIQDKVENHLAKELLSGKIKTGDKINLEELP